MIRQEESAVPSLASGLVGATALTLVHQAAKHLFRDAPRMDIIGRRAIAKGMESVGQEPAKRAALQTSALVGDMLLNSLYYALIGAGRVRHPFARGSTLGTMAGIGAIMLPPLMGLGRKERGHTPEGKAMTIGWYLIGGLAAAAAYRAFQASDCCKTR